MTRALPPTASVAHAQEGGKLHAPAAERNGAAIAEVLRAHAPQAGTALEIASGTGQHIALFAAALPALQWQPTDIDPDRLRSIDAHVAAAQLTNVAPALHLDATRKGWAADHPGQALIVLVNLLHLISVPEARTLLTEAATALAPTGTLVIYGPFAREGQLTSDGDARFDAELRAADPAIGYKDTRDMKDWLAHEGLSATTQEMPANNLAFVCRKPA